MFKRSFKKFVASVNNSINNLVDDGPPPETLSYFRDFTQRFGQVQQKTDYLLFDKERRDIIALLCLDVLNSCIEQGLIGAGYLNPTKPVPPNLTIPSYPSHSLPSELWYACRFWQDHLSDIPGPPSEDVVRSYSRFASRNITAWLEIVLSRGLETPALDKLRVYFKRTMPPTHPIHRAFYTQHFAVAYTHLYALLSRASRTTEMVTATKETLEIYRYLTEVQPATYKVKLVQTLNQLRTTFRIDKREQEATDIAREVILVCQRDVSLDGNSAYAECADYLAGRLFTENKMEEAATIYPEAIRQYEARLKKGLPAKDAQRAQGRLNVCLFALSKAQIALGLYDQGVRTLSELIERQRGLLSEEKTGTRWKELIDSLIRLATAQCEAGDAASGLLTASEAVEISRQFVQSKPTDPTPAIISLAQSLRELSFCLGALDCGDEALEAVTEAVTIVRERAKTSPEACNPVLILCLRRLSDIHGEAGRELETLEVSREFRALEEQSGQPASESGQSLDIVLNMMQALRGDSDARDAAARHAEELVELWKGNLDTHSRISDYILAVSQLTRLLLLLPGRKGEALLKLREAAECLHRPQLQTNEARRSRVEALETVSELFMTLDYPEDALPLVEELVTLTQDTPGLLPNSTTSPFSMLGKCLLALGRSAESVDACRQGVDAERMRWKQTPTRNDRQEALCGALTALSKSLSKVGDLEGSLAASQEVVALHRTAGKTKSLLVDLPDLYGALTELGRYDEALVIIDEAIQTCRQSPEFGFELGYTLFLRAGCRALSPKDAFETLEEAHQLVRIGYVADAMLYEELLSRVLQSLALHHSSQGQREAALEYAKEAVEVVAQKDQEHVADGNEALSIGLAGVGKKVEALEKIEEALRAYQTPDSVGKLPRVSDDRLGSTIYMLSYRLFDLKRYNDALEAAEKSLALLGDVNSRSIAAKLSRAARLEQFSKCLSKVGREDEALLVMQDAMPMFRDLIQFSSRYKHVLALALINYSLRLQDVARADDALAPVQESLDILRENVVEYPAKYEPDLSLALDTKASALHLLGRIPEAVAAIEEAISIRRRLAASHPAVFQEDLDESLEKLSKFH